MSGDAAAGAGDGTKRDGRAALGIIGGTGLTTLEGLEIARRETVQTPWGAPSGPLVRGRLCDRDVVFLPRHGEAHTIPPHRVNYRANVQALADAGVGEIVAVAAVGGIHPELAPGRVAIPDQMIDYTYGRDHTFFEEDLDAVVHVDFTRPYCDRLRGRLVEAARRLGLDAYEGGTYAVTQGPRLETAAEVDRLERDGCDMVGMTGMPEAGLARELGLGYAHCAVIVNAAAGRGEGEITLAAMHDALRVGMREVHALLAALVGERAPAA